MTPPLLEVRGVTRRFGGLVAVNDVSLTVGRGEIVGLIGPNGAGKSTLFGLIAGAIAPSSGTILFEGEDVSALPAARRCRRGIGRTFQVVKSFDSMSVVDNVVVGALARHPNASKAREKAYEVLDFAGLAGRAAAPAGDLTPPEKRRLEVARALATEPKLLLLDEVMTGLTPAEAQKGVELVRRVRDTGVTVVMVEHVMEIVMPLVDRAFVMHLGRELAHGKPADVAANEDVVAAYLGSRRRAA